MEPQELKEKNLEAHRIRIERKIADTIRRRLRWRERFGKGIGKGGTQVARAFPVINDKKNSKGKHERFKSAVIAAKKYGVSKGAIHFAIGNPNRTCCGLRWAFEKDGVPPEWKNPAVVRPGSRNKEYLKSVGRIYA